MSVFFCSAQYAQANNDSLGHFVVNNTAELRDALKQAEQYPLGAKILLQDGSYELVGSPLLIKQEFITIQSYSGIRQKVVISGQGMDTGLGNLIDVSADHFSLIGLTLKDAKWHLIQVRAEKDVDYFYMDNCILQDSGQQLLKVSHNKNGPYADFGIVKNSLFRYTSGMGPHYYIGGIDAHKSADWLVQNNTFRDISSPKDRVAEHAIHFWNDSKNIKTINNTIINSDRGIGYGLMNREYQSKGGLIKGNIIIHNRSSNPFADVGISLESSPDTQVIDNMIFLNTSYPNAIEYRFEHTKNVLIKGNYTNKSITSRNGGSATLIDNQSTEYSKSIVEKLKSALN